MISVVGIVYNARSSEAKKMAGDIAGLVGPGRESWSKAAGDLGEQDAFLKETDLIVTVGGDGTILRTARAAVAHDIPLLGVNMGRLGFMTELRPADALERIPGFLEGGGWVEERSMIKARVFDGATSEGRRGVGFLQFRMASCVERRGRDSWRDAAAHLGTRAGGRRGVNVLPSGRGCSEQRDGEHGV